jgi:hypothetical protein
VSKIKEKIEKGENIREDNFFSKDPSNRSSFEEITEGVLLSAQKEHEEKKVRFLGNLIANISFNSSINRADANLYVNLAEALSYRQYCLLALLALEEMPIR